MTNHDPDTCPRCQFLNKEKTPMTKSPCTVAQLIEALSKLPPDLPVRLEGASDGVLPATGEVAERNDPVLREQFALVRCAR